jgi:curved DNA-binding protein CbpA
MLNYYELLKISPDSSKEEIEQAFNIFKSELLKFSPGVDLSEEELKKRKPELWETFDVLLDTEKRKKYDEIIERDRIDELHESQKKIEKEENIKSSKKRKYLGLGVTIIIVVIYFLFQNNSNDNLTEEPKWKTHYITDEIQVVLPAPADTNVNIIPPYLMNYIKSMSCCQSDLKGGFSVTIARFVMDDNFKISEKDISYIVNTEMGSHMTVHKPDSINFAMNIRGFRVFVRKGTYTVEGTLRAFENYSMLKGNTAIKIIVAYVPGDEKQIKYTETVFNSLTCF